MRPNLLSHLCVSYVFLSIESLYNSVTLSACHLVTLSSSHPFTLSSFLQSSFHRRIRIQDSISHIFVRCAAVGTKRLSALKRLRRLDQNLPCLLNIADQFRVG